MKFTVAIDGPAAAGKGTIARAVAAHFGFAHLDTGMLYRAVGAKTLDFGRGVIDPVYAEEIAKRLREDDLVREDLRSIRVTRAASRVAAIPGVRASLLEFQRKFAARNGGAVLDGRDIGTVICPDANLKLYVTASDEVRARRRHEELSAKGSNASIENVAADLASRDARDAERDHAPMKAAEDAILLDTTDLSIETAIAEAVRLTQLRMGAG